MTILYCNGMYRSGSTFTFNLCNHLHKQYKDRVPKPHKIHEKWVTRAKPTDLLIYSYRDIRVSAASLMRKKKLDINSFTKFHKQGLVNWLEMLVDYDNSVKNSCNKKLILRYEEDILNLQNAIYKTSKFLNIELSASRLKELNNVFSIQNTKAFVDSLSRHDVNTQYYPNHIGADRTDYKDYFDSLLYKNSDKIRDWLTKNNYETV